MMWRSMWHKTTLSMHAQATGACHLASGWALTMTSSPALLRPSMCLQMRRINLPPACPFCSDRPHCEATRWEGAKHMSSALSQMRNDAPLITTAPVQDPVSFWNMAALRLACQALQKPGCANHGSLKVYLSAAFWPLCASLAERPQELLRHTRCRFNPQPFMTIAPVSWTAS